MKGKEKIKRQYFSFITADAQKLVWLRISKLKPLHSHNKNCYTHCFEVKFTFC